MSPRSQAAIVQEAEVNNYFGGLTMANSQPKPTEKQKRMTKIAIIETGGKQHLVEEGSVHHIEKLSGSHKAGDTLTFDKVLLVDDGSRTSVGKPYIEGAKVSAELVEEGRGEKITVIHYRQKSRYFKKSGHRQQFAKIKITALP